ncbi:MAG: hypothetical protein QOF30_585 [Acidimicrobiaceae bacterium]|nr:hypothetical protein [Acidimicrobiaceae bacterium]
MIAVLWYRHDQQSVKSNVDCYMSHIEAGFTDAQANAACH